LFRDNGPDYIEIHAGVFMHGHVAKPDHLLHSCGEIGQ
jgi:hypothetical protein